MRTIREYFELSSFVPTHKQSDLLVSDDCVGLEMELENMPTHPGVPRWRREPDGSLRNHGIEYVFDGPQAGEDVVKAVDDLLSAFKKHGCRPISNERTSMHVHIDMRDVSMRDLGRFLLVYASLEDVLFSICDKSRIDNPYAVPMTSSSIMLAFMRRAYRDGRSSSSALSEGNRYGAINVASLRRYGTVEVRMRETLLDRNEILFWINIFLAIKSFTRNWSALDDNCLLSTVSALGVDTVYSMILTDEIFNEIKARVPDYEDMIMSSIRRVQSHIMVPPNPSFRREPIMVEDNILLRQAVATGRERELLSYAEGYGLDSLVDELRTSMGIYNPPRAVVIAAQQGEAVFEVSEAGAALYNTAVRTNYPLQAGQMLSMDRLRTRLDVLSRASVVERVGRRINYIEILTEDSAQLYAHLITPSARPVRLPDFAFTMPRDHRNA